MVSFFNLKFTPSFLCLLFLFTFSLASFSPLSLSQSTISSICIKLTVARVSSKWLFHSDPPHSGNQLLLLRMLYHSINFCFEKWMLASPALFLLTLVRVGFKRWTLHTWEPNKRWSAPWSRIIIHSDVDRTKLRNDKMITQEH